MNPAIFFFCIYHEGKLHYYICIVCVILLIPSNLSSLIFYDLLARFALESEDDKADDSAFLFVIAFGDANKSRN